MRQVWGIAVVMVFAACTPQNNYENVDQPAAAQKSSELSNRHNPMELPVRELHLNQGDKWKVSPEMLAHVDQMQREIEEYRSAGDGDFHALASALDHHLARLIRASNLQGGGQQEFNLWVFPVMQRTEAMAQTVDPEMSDVLIGDIQSELKVFGKYFE